MASIQTLWTFGTLVVSVIAGFLVFVQYRHSYWARHGIPNIRPKVTFKNVAQNNHIALMVQDYYKKFHGKGLLGGVYVLLQPLAIAMDLDFIKRILITDFQYFESRGMFSNKHDDPLTSNLFALDPEPWRLMRKQLSTTFTSSKMKFMFSTIMRVSGQLETCLTELIKSENGPLEMKELFARYTTDVIGTCGFGIECNSLGDPNATFRNMGKKLASEGRHPAIVILLITLFPKMARMLKAKIINDDVSDFFKKIVHETIEYREKNNVKMNDFLDQLISMKNAVKETNSDSVITMTIDQITAEVFVFFLAGFESSASAMAFTMYELSMNPALQNRARQEISDALSKHNGVLTYEAVQEIKYIDQIINETLRKYPPAGIVFRKCTKDYEIQEYNYTLPKDTQLMIPVYGIHHDPEIYPEPSHYDPERFTSDAIKARHPMAFLPFGNGPRNCIAMRFGMMQTKIGLISMISGFEFSLCSRTTIPLGIAQENFPLTPDGGLWLTVTKIENSK